MALGLSVSVGRSDWLGCAGLLAWLGIVAGPIYLYFHFKAGYPADLLFAAVPATVAFVTFGMLQEALQIRGSERRARHAAGGQLVLQDGHCLTVSGTIEPVEGQEPMQAPFTGRTCVDYQYDVASPASGHKGRVAFLGGYGHVPSQIRTPNGLVHILAAPDLNEIAAHRCTSVEERERAIAYVRNTKFEEFAILHWMKAYREGLELAGPIGPVRKDSSTGRGVFNPENDSLEERIIEPGATVTLTGTYSAAGGGLVADTRDPMSMVVMLQDAGTAERDLRSRVRARAIVAVVIVALVYAAFFYFITHAER